MRIKKDKSNWRASAIIKRDFKHDSSQPDVIKHHSKKNKRRWCRGKIGVDHTYKLKEESKFLEWSWKTYVCEVCRRKDYQSSK